MLGFLSENWNHVSREIDSLVTPSVCIRFWMLVLVVMPPLPAWEIMKPIMDAIFTGCAI